jgi:branched-chain amino acid aminotransferase
MRTAPSLSYTCPVPLVFVNGEMVDEERAVVSVFDHGLLTGDGVFESLLVQDGQPFAVAEHLDRLEQSAARIGLAVPPRSHLEEAVRTVAAQSDTPRGKLRLTLTGGRGLLSSTRLDVTPTLIVALSALEDAPPGAASVLVVPWPKNEHSILAGSKTTSYAENVAALGWAEARGADEALFLNTGGNLCEGTGSNIFVVLDGRIVTPPLSAGCLAGVTRALLLEACDIDEVDIPANRLEGVTEAFLSSTTRGVQPIASFDGRSLGDVPGPLTATCATAFDKLASEKLAYHRRRTDTEEVLQ